MAFRSAATTAHGSSDWTATAPSGVTAGDREIAIVSQDNAGATITFPTGFGTPQTADLSGPDSQTVWIAERITSGGDSYAFSSTTSNSGVTHILAFSGRHASTASTFGTVTQNTTSNPSPISASCNGVTAANGDDVVLVLGIDITSSGATASWSTPPTNYTERSSSSSGLGCALTCSRDNVGAGATGSLTGTITLSAGNAGYGGYAIAIPSGGGISIAPGLGQLTVTGQQPTALRSGDYQLSTEQAIFNLQSSIPEHIKTSKEPPSPVASDGTATTVGAATTAWSINFPSASIGDMIVAIIAWDDSTTVTSVTAPAGPNSETATSIVGPQASASTEMRMQAWRWIATGAWTAGQRTFTPIAAETCNAFVFKIAKGQFDPNTPIGASAGRSSAGTAESAVLSPSFSVGSTDGDGRLLIAYGSDVDAITAPASGTTTLRNNTSGGVGFCVVTRNAYLTNSESLTATTATIASDSWASLAFVLRAPDNPIVHVPGEGRLSLVGYEPTVTNSGAGSPSISTGLGALTLTGLAPDVIVPIFIAPGLGALTLTGLSPSLNFSANPGLGALTITGLAPSLDIGIGPGLGALTITGLAPDVSVQGGITTGLGSLVINGFAPTLSSQGNITTGLGALVITGYDVTQTLTLPSPAAAALVITGLAPTISVSQNVFINPGLGQLSLTGLAPQIGNNPNISSGLGELVITGLAPTVSVTDHQFVTSGLGDLQITGLAPEVREQLYISLGIDGLTLTGYAPTLQENTGANISTGLAELLINGYAPTIEGADEERRTVGVPGRSYQFLIYINGKPHYGDQDEIRELIEELAEKDAEQPKKPRTRIVVQQGKPILKSEPKPTKAELMQVQTNLRDYYLEVYAKIKLKEMEDDEDFLLLL